MCFPYKTLALTHSYTLRCDFGALKCTVSLLYCDIFGSHYQLGIIIGAVSALVTVAACELVVRLQTLLYWPSCLLFSIGLQSTRHWKFGFWHQGLSSISTLCQRPCLSLHFFQMLFQFCWYPCVFLTVVQGFQIVLLWTMHVKAIKTWLIQCLCQIFSASCNGNHVSVIPSSCSDIWVYLVLLLVVMSTNAFLLPVPSGSFCYQQQDDEAWAD